MFLVKISGFKLNFESQFDIFHAIFCFMKYNGEKADTCSIFATVCPNHFEMCPIDLFHIVFAHACICHVTRYFSIIGETLHRWGKRILNHWHFLCNQ